MLSVRFFDQGFYKFSLSVCKSLSFCADAIATAFSSFKIARSNLFFFKKSNITTLTAFCFNKDTHRYLYFN